MLGLCVGLTETLPGRMDLERLGEREGFLEGD